MKGLRSIFADLSGNNVKRIATRDKAYSPTELPPGHFDKSRMAKALAGPRFEIPQGLSPDEIGEFIKRVAKRHK